MKTDQAKAQLRGLRMSPRKVRLLVDLIRGMRVEEARLQLQFSTKSAALPVMKLLDSAVANAVHNGKMIKETLVVAEAYVDGGPVLKRWRPRAFGRASAIKKRSSHITIIVGGNVKEESNEVPSKKKVVVAKKDEKKETTKKTVAVKKETKALQSQDTKEANK